MSPSVPPPSTPLSLLQSGGLAVSRACAGRAPATVDSLQRSAAVPSFCGCPSGACPHDGPPVSSRRAGAADHRSTLCRRLRLRPVTSLVSSGTIGACLAPGHSRPSESELSRCHGTHSARHRPAIAGRDAPVPDAGGAIREGVLSALREPRHAAVNVDPSNHACGAGRGRAPLTRAAASLTAGSEEPTA